MYKFSWDRIEILVLLLQEQVPLELINLFLGNCLWMDPLVEREKLSAVNIIQTSLNVRTMLLTEGFGEPNNQVWELML